MENMKEYNAQRNTYGPASLAAVRLRNFTVRRMVVFLLGYYHPTQTRRVANPRCPLSECVTRSVRPEKGPGLLFWGTLMVNNPIVFYINTTIRRMVKFFNSLLRIRNFTW